MSEFVGKKLRIRIGANIGIPAAIRMVATSRNIALVVEQPVQDMQGFTCCRRDRLGVEWRVAAIALLHL
jgi:hypothetical protein